MARPKEGYRLADGTPAPGVTTILEILAKPALLHWAYEQGRLAERGVIQSLYERRDAAAETGTVVHDMAEAYERGQVPEACLEGLTPEQSSRAQSGFLAFLEWRQSSGLKAIETETPLVSERYRYGGTLDVVYRDLRTNGTVLGDYKTGKAIYAETWLQLAAYALLYEEHHLNTILTGYQVLRFDKQTGGYEVAWKPEINVWRTAWLTVLEAYRALRACEGKS
jgi:hypothetical protein